MDDARMEGAAAANEPISPGDAEPTSPAPNLFLFVTGGLTVALVAILVFGALSLTGDIAELRATADDNARAIADLRGDVARTIGSLRAKPASGEVPASRPGGLAP